MQRIEYITEISIFTRACITNHTDAVQLNNLLLEAILWPPIKQTIRSINLTVDRQVALLQ